MKNLFKVGAMALFMVFASCNSDDSTPNNNNSVQGTITAKVNGEDWTGTITSATLLKVSQMGEQRFDITAEGDGKRIMLACSSAIAAGMPLETYSFEAQAAGNALFLNYYLVGNNAFSVHMPETGQLTMTSFNSTTKRASGTFEFTLYKIGEINGMQVPENFVVTEGHFNNVLYVEYAQ